MSLDAWIIDELEEDEAGQGDRPELGIRSPYEGEADAPRRPVVRRGVRILDISPDMENVIDL